MLTPLKNFLTLPMARGVDLDRPEALSLHRRILQEKKFLRRLYEECYGIFLRESKWSAHPQAKYLELGTGGGFLKETMRSVITSDVCAAPFIDRVVDAGHLPFEANELQGIFLLNVLHHLPKPKAFFAEARRCLAPGGRVVMIEPFNSWFAKFMYTRFHHEPFDDSVAAWESSGEGRMTTSNQAIPWIIFWRDKDTFEKEFPELKIVKREPHTAIGYLVSGGMSLRSFVPGFAYPAVALLDRTLSRWSRMFPMFQTIVLEKGG